MKSLSEMPQKLVLFFSSKVEREAAEFSWQRERERGAPLLSSFSFLSNLLPPVSLPSLSACGSRAPPCWVPPLLLSPHRRLHPAHHGGEERAHGGGGRAAGRGRRVRRKAKKKKGSARERSIKAEIRRSFKRQGGSCCIHSLSPVCGPQCALGVPGQGQ